MSIGKSNSSLMILTSTCPSICPDLSAGPPMAVQASSVTSSFQPYTSACLFFRQISSICSYQMMPRLSWSNSEMSLHSQNYSKWRSRRWRAVYRSQMLIWPLPSSSRSQMAVRQQLISSSVSMYCISSIYDLFFCQANHNIYNSNPHFPSFKLFLLLFQILRNMTRQLAYLSDRQNYRYKLTMFNALTQWCRRQPCIYTQQKKYQMEVSPFFYVQEQLNRLPTFQSQYQNHHSPAKSTHRKYQEQRRRDMQEQLLKRVKSEPDCEIRQSRPNDKENIHFSYAHDHHAKPPPFVHRSHERPAIRILYETSEKTTQLRSPRMPPNTTISTHPTPAPVQTTTIADSRASSEEGVGRDGSRTVDMVPLEEFNRMVNINLKLIKLIEEDYRPIRTSVSHLEQQHHQRRRMIEALEERVHRIRGELIAER